jgi:calcium binding protein 39
MLRECFKHEGLCKIVLNSDDFYQFFKFIDLENFDVAVDAFGTFKEVLSNRQKTALVPEFLVESYDKFFGAYNKLLASNLYVTKRQSLKLLSEILMDRSNAQVRDKYLAHVENLKLIMNLLVNKAQGIKIEAYNVFKLFVYNPKKSDGIKNILLLNRDKLVSYLTEFKVKDDIQFEEEKEKVVKKIQDLQ